MKTELRMSPEERGGERQRSTAAAGSHHFHAASTFNNSAEAISWLKSLFSQVWLNTAASLFFFFSPVSPTGTIPPLLKSGDPISDNMSGSGGLKMVVTITSVLVVAVLVFIMLMVLKRRRREQRLKRLRGATPETAHCDLSPPHTHTHTF